MAKEITELLQTAGDAGDSAIGLDSGLGLVRRDSVPYDKDAAAVDSSGTDLFVGVSVSGEARTFNAIPYIKGAAAVDSSGTDLVIGLSETGDARTFNAIPYIKGDTAATPAVDDLVVGIGDDGSAKQFTVASLATTLEGESFGTAAFVNTGTAAGEVPLNSDLGSASTRDVGDGDADVVTNFKLNSRVNSRVRTYDPSSPRLSTRAIPTGSSNWGTSRMTPDGTKVWITSGQPEATQHSLSTPFDMTTVSSEEASLSLPNSTQHILWNADGTMAYFVSNGAEEVYEVSLSTAYDLSTAGAVTTRSISSWSTTYNPVDWNTSYFGPTGDELFILTYNTNNGQSAFSSHELSTPYRIDTVGTGLESIVIDVDTTIRGFSAMSEDGEYVITFSTHTVVSERHLNSYVVYNLTTPYSLDSATPIQRGKLGLPMTTALQFISHVQILDDGKKLVLNYKYSGEVVNSIVVINLTTVSFE